MRARYHDRDEIRSPFPLAVCLRQGKAYRSPKRYYYLYYSRSEVPSYFFFGTCGPLAKRTGERNLLSERTGPKSGDLWTASYRRISKKQATAEDHQLASAKVSIFEDFRGAERLESVKAKVRHCPKEEEQGTL